MDTPQPPDNPYAPPPTDTGAQPAPPTEPGDVTGQHAADPGAQQQAYQQQAADPTAQTQAAAPAYDPAAYPQQAAQQPAQPYAQQPYYGYQQPYAQAGYQQQPYGYPQYGAYYAQPGYYQPYNAGPDNTAATWSIALSGTAVGLLFFTVGFSAPLSLILAVIGIVLGVKGKKAVDEGKTRKHRDMAVAGFWTGIAGVILSLLAIAALVLFIVYVADSGGEADPGDLATLWGIVAPPLSP